MNNKSVYTIKPKDFKMLERMADNVYNTAVVVDHYCKTQLEIEELYHLAPVVRNLRKDADQIAAFFINYPESIN